ncbi:MAG: hypothetical protein R6U19_07995 [Bacteroidales bacterium]
MTFLDRTHLSPWKIRFALIHIALISGDSTLYIPEKKPLEIKNTFSDRAHTFEYFTPAHPVKSSSKVFIFDQ